MVLFGQRTIEFKGEFMFKSLLDTGHWLSVSPLLQRSVLHIWKLKIMYFLYALAACARMRIRLHYLNALVCFTVFLKWELTVFEYFRCQAFYTHYSFNLHSNPARYVLYCSDFVGKETETQEKGIQKIVQSQRSSIHGGRSPITIFSLSVCVLKHWDPGHKNYLGGFRSGLCNATSLGQSFSMLT